MSSANASSFDNRVNGNSSIILTFSEQPYVSKMMSSKVKSFGNDFGRKKKKKKKKKKMMC